MKNKLFTRRAFMRTLGVLGLGTALTPAPAMAAVRMIDSKKLGDKRFKVSEMRFLMGTYVSITAIHESKSAAEAATGRAFEEMQRLTAIFDRHQANTPVSVLNETGRLTDVAPELHAVMTEALAITRQSQGAFDTTVLPVVSMLKSHVDAKGKLDLSKRDLADALALVDSESVTVSSRAIRFDKQGMAVTLDGIGKGYIVDRASDIMAANGVGNHLINAGGDIRARGERAPGTPWTVAIEDPAQKGNYPAIVHLKDAAIATSGGYEQVVSSDKAHHHVVNPKTAFSPTQSVSVSVTAPTVMHADALSTAVFVMSPKTGVQLINERADNECLVVGNTGAKLTSRRWNTNV